MTNERLDSITAVLIIGIACVLPIFFLPGTLVPIGVSKPALFFIGIFLALCLWSIGRLRESSLTIPYSLISIPVVLLPLIALLSAFFSDTPLHSMVGEGFEVDTALAAFALSASFFLGTMAFARKDRTVKLYLALAASFLVFAAYQFVRLLGGIDTLSFGMFYGPTANLLGKWNDIAIFSGVIALLSLTTLHLLRPAGLLKALFGGALLLASALLIVVNFSVVWIALAIASFLLFVRSFFEKKFAHVEDVESVTLDRSSGSLGLVAGFFIVSVMFSFAGPLVESYTNSFFTINQVEARPSWGSTASILSDVYSRDPLTGTGPNNFTKTWLTHKPGDINQTPFWDTDFLFGVGVIPSMFVTNGILSLISWVCFLGLFLWAGIRTFMDRGGKRFDMYMRLSSFLAAFFLWVLSIWYVPHLALFFLAFLLTGVYVAAEARSGALLEKTISFREHPKMGFASILLLFAVLGLSAYGAYHGATRAVAFAYATQAERKALSGGFDEAHRDINRAALFTKSDAVFRTGAEIANLELTHIIRAGDGGADAQQRFQSALVRAIDRARSAAAIDEHNYQNWVSFGRIYETLVPLRVEGAYENAKVAYERSALLNPHNPRLQLNLARIEALNGNTEAARAGIAEALRMKNDYTNAIFLLAQIEIQEGNVPEAIRSVEAATLLSPQDPTAFFQLGILKYSEGDYEGAIAAFERAVSLDTQYSNARYFLGLSYHEEGRAEDARTQFETIALYNPGNSHVASIISNLVAGRAPLDDFTPPADPLEGDGLPFEE